METITGASSLISWNNTKNTSGIKATPSHNDFIRKEYLRFFEGLKALEYTNNFCECWLKYCTSFEKSFVQSMNNFLIASEENILNIWYKFKGNVGGRPSGLFKPYGYNKRASSTSKDGSFKKDIIQFETKEEAENFYESTQTNFYKTLNFFGRYYTTMNGPSFSFALPYMNDYSKVWTDKDYCEYFNLTKEESEFMCREVDDYRVKDFIEYEEI